MIGHIKFYTSLVLIFFLIAQANYMIKLNRNVKKKELQRNLGIVFGFLLIIKILVFYYSSIPIIWFLLIIWAQMLKRIKWMLI